MYLRQPAGGSFESIPADILEDCAQLVKANSIQGNKLNNITVVYTPWANLKKTQSMDVGQVHANHHQISTTLPDLCHMLCHIIIGDTAV